MKTKSQTAICLAAIALSIAAVTITKCNIPQPSPIMDALQPSTLIGKPLEYNNPISPVVFCADPTGVEFDGRLYIYGTNDHQQYQNADKNGYEKIKSLVCFSTADMVNWEYHGIINTEKIAPWIMNSWAPSIIERKEADSLTHYYLYFSNSGLGVGVITATHPLGPWTDAKGTNVVQQQMPEIGDCPAPFDPGICIGADGVPYLAFGGGVAKDCTNALPGVARIARLKPDMVTVDEVAVIDAPYFFEASELNYIDGEYIYTLNNNWFPRDQKPWPDTSIAMPSVCSMAYMKTRTPMDRHSWQYGGEYFPNPGTVGMPFSNNHTHFMKYKGQYWMLYHAMHLQDSLRITGGFRNLMVDKLNYDEQANAPQLTQPTLKGVDPIDTFSPYQKVRGTVMSHAAQVWFQNDQSPDSIATVSQAPGAWTALRNVSFGDGAKWITATIDGQGYIEVRAGSLDSPAIAFLTPSCGKVGLISQPKGNADLFFIFSKEGIVLHDWEMGE